jgi:hypothetical protein
MFKNFDIDDMGIDEDDESVPLYIRKALQAQREAQEAEALENERLEKIRLREEELREDELHEVDCVDYAHEIAYDAGGYFLTQEEYDEFMNLRKLKELSLNKQLS